MYKDIELKTRYHKEKIITGFIKNGIYPDHKLIKIKLENIETRLSIFKAPEFIEGEYININLLNNAMADIYNDIKILYELLYEITIKKYNNLSYFVESHLRELDNMSDMYIKKAKLESLSAVVGSSILFKHNEFLIEKNETESIIKLGEIKIRDGSSIICIADTLNIDHKNISFKFTIGEKIQYCNSYSFSQESLTFPGKNEIKEYHVKINESQKINDLLELPIMAIKNDGDRFVTLAGKDKILCKNTNKEGDIINEFSATINSLSFDSHSYIDFYVVGGNNINFRFNKNPISANFNTSNNSITNLSYIEHFFIECDEDFSFDFELDKGSIYAVKENTIIKNNNFYYSGVISLNDFLVVHYLSGDLQNYNIEMHISDINILTSDINSIMIKEIN